MSVKKSVLVNVPYERKFKISFVSNPLKSDLEVFRITFEEVCRKDFLLQNVIEDPANHFIFEKFDDLFQCDVEITDNDTIEHGSILNASVISTFISDHTICQVSRIKMPIRITPVVDSQQIQATTIESIVKVEVPTEEYNELETTNSECQEIRTNLHKEVLPDLVNSNRTSPEKAKKGLIYGPPNFLKEQRKSNQRTTIKYPCELPGFTVHVKKDLEDGTIYTNHHFHRFIRECATFVLSTVAVPTRQDYNNFCRSVSDIYPCLYDKEDYSVPFGYFKRMLSKSVRNARYYNRARVKKKENHNYSSLVEFIKREDISSSNEIMEELKNMLEDYKDEEEKTDDSSEFMDEIRNIHEEYKVKKQKTEDPGELVEEIKLLIEEYKDKN